MHMALFARTNHTKPFNTPLFTTSDTVELMLMGQSCSRSPNTAFLLVALFLASLMTSMAPAAPDQTTVQELENERVIYPVSVPEQTYELYLDAPTSETGGQGSITTIEPNGGQEEGSAIDGLEYRSAEMISDLYVNGSGASNTARLSVYIQFRGSEGSTASVTFSLKSGDNQITSENRELEDPCSSNPLAVDVHGASLKSSLISVPMDSWSKKASNSKSALMPKPVAMATPEGSVRVIVPLTSPSGKWKVQEVIHVFKS
jgi:hypothetical protein